MEQLRILLERLFVGHNPGHPSFPRSGTTEPRGHSVWNLDHAGTITSLEGKNPVLSSPGIVLGAGRREPRAEICPCKDGRKKKQIKRKLVCKIVSKEVRKRSKSLAKSILFRSKLEVGTTRIFEKKHMPNPVMPFNDFCSTTSNSEKIWQFHRNFEEVSQWIKFHLTALHQWITR